MFEPRFLFGETEVKNYYGTLAARYAPFALRSAENLISGYSNKDIEDLSKSYTPPVWSAGVRWGENLNSRLADADYYSMGARSLKNICVSLGMKDSNPNEDFYSVVPVTGSFSDLYSHAIGLNIMAYFNSYHYLVLLFGAVYDDKTKKYFFRNMNTSALESAAAPFVFNQINGSNFLIQHQSLFFDFVIATLFSLFGKYIIGYNSVKHSLAYTKDYKMKNIIRI